MTQDQYLAEENDLSVCVAKIAATIGTRQRLNSRVSHTAENVVF